MTENSNNKYKVNQFVFISKFQCNAKKCFYDCCSRYVKVKVEPYLLELYEKEAPEILNFVEKREGYYSMGNVNRYCHMFKENLCEIQKKYGIHFLPEPCHTYPRIYHKFNDEIYITASFCCSEVLKSALFSENAFSLEEVFVERIPEFLTNPSYRDLKTSDVKKFLDINSFIFQLIDDENYDSEETLLRLLIFSELLDRVRKSDWPNIVNRLINLLNYRDLRDIYENINESMMKDTLDNYIVSLLAMTKNNREKDFEEILDTIILYLNNKEQERDIKNFWRQNIRHSPMDRLLKNYIKAKISETLFPVHNWGRSFTDIMFIIIAYTGIRLGLITYYSRIKDISDELILKIITNFEGALWGTKNEVLSYYRDLGWTNFERLAGLLIRC